MNQTKIKNNITLPDFLIVGAMKSGTTTLKHYLGQHPKVFMPQEELHFFDKDKHFTKGLNWYERYFKQAGNEQILGEKTPTYSYLPKCPERIANTIPDVKLIWIFRDPVDRAYSNYWHAVNSGSERLSFSEAIEREEERIRKSPWYGYKRRGIYIEQVKNYLTYFSRKDMCFLIFEKLINSQKEELDRVYEFLDLPEYSPSQAKKNKTYIPNSIILQYLSRKIFGRGKIFGIINRLNHFSKKTYPDMDPKIEEYLKNYFEPYNEKLFKLIDREAKMWED